jgi:hypothetical protein
MNKLQSRRFAVKKQACDLFCEEELVGRSEPSRNDIKTVSFSGGMV